MGGEEVEEGARILREAGIPTFAYPDTACILFNHLWRYDAQPALACTRPRACPIAPERGEFREEVDQIIADVSRRGPHPAHRVREQEGPRRVRHPDHGHRARHDARTRRSRRPTPIGYPVVAKLLSPDDHPQDRRRRRGPQPAQLRTPSARPSTRIRDSVAEKVGAEHFEGVTIQPMINWSGYELIVGSSPDPQFGPVLLFGMGGQLVEVFKDRALALPPLNTTLARQLIDETTISPRAQGRPRPQAHRQGRAGRAAGALQRARRRAAAHRRDRHQPAAGLARAGHRARRARGPAPGGDRGRGPAAPRHPPVPARVRARGDHGRRRPRC